MIDNRYFQRNMLAISFFALMFLVSTAVASDKPELSEMEKQIVSIADTYVEIQSLLSNDSIENIIEKTSAIDEAVSLISDAEKAKETPDEKLLARLNSISEAASGYNVEELTLENARANFYALSESVVELVESALPEDVAAGYPLFYCPMAKGYWLGSGDEVNNPYYGSEMLKCGKKISYPEECVAAHKNCNCPGKNNPAHNCGCLYRSKAFNMHAGCPKHKNAMKNAPDSNKLNDD